MALQLNCGRNGADAIAFFRMIWGQSKAAREFEFTLLRQRVSKFSDISENRSKSARVRAICDEAWTRRAAAAGA